MKKFFKILSISHFKSTAILKKTKKYLCQRPIFQKLKNNVQEVCAIFVENRSLFINFYCVFHLFVLLCHKKCYQDENMSSIIRFGVSLDKKLLDGFDALIHKKGYKKRSEAIRDLIRQFLVEEEWKSDTEIIGCLTLVYDHHVRKLSEELLRIQHDHYINVLSTLHMHLDHDNCLEVIVVRGNGKEVRHFSDLISGQRGVKFGKLTPATTGKSLA